MKNYREGFPFLKVVAPATVGAGILQPNESDQAACIKAADAFTGTLVKFVPASGAASRMFKDIFDARDKATKGPLPIGSAGEKFIALTPSTALWDSSLENKSDLEILDYVLNTFAARPKGLIPFHCYTDGSRRTPFEEHLVEGALYAKGKDNVVKVHFTVSPAHMEGFKALAKTAVPALEQRFGVKYDLSYSVQDPNTDLPAVNADNTPFTIEDGSVLRRPAGHGALLGNLGSIDADVIVLKNIDNVVHESHVVDTVTWKKILIGELILLRGRIYNYLNALEQAIATKADSSLLCADIAAFLKESFGMSRPKNSDAAYLYEKLHRPIRVCGMVRNEGEPGGGPFIIAEEDGSISLQSLEKAQLDSSNPAVLKAAAESTHFNPVDLVCCTIDHKGVKYNLPDYVDPSTGLISEKSYQGRVLKAQELPGLWNGSMSRWNTLFVEVPLSTFNPVKTVLDLGRPAHKA